MDRLWSTTNPYKVYKLDGSYTRVAEVSTFEEAVLEMVKHPYPTRVYKTGGGHPTLVACHKSTAIL